MELLKIFVQSLTPSCLRPIIKKLYAHFSSFVYRGNNYECPICRGHFRKMIPGGLQEDIFREKKVIGAGLRENAMCPTCNASERQRLEYLYLKEHTSIFQAPCKVLHFAPEYSLTQVFNSHNNIEYITGDVQNGRAMFVVDITDPPFGDNEFDYIICNHVLEHIPDEKKALSEIRRILKNDGCAIIIIPICIDNEITFEDANITSPKERLKNYGQSDHVRLYGRDFPCRLTASEFEVECFNCGENFDSETIRRYALIRDETVFIAKKTKSNDRFAHSGGIYSDGVPQYPFT